MEPLFFKAENTKPGRATFSLELEASMEPLFFKAENPKQRVVVIADNDTLQWSRFFSKRKMVWALPASRPASRSASMEPLFFKAENVFVDTLHRFFAGDGFNGAAFFQSGK